MHTQTMWAAQQSMPQITPFPRDHIQITGQPGSRRTVVTGLSQALEECYANWQLPSERDLPWSARGRDILICKDAW